MKILLLSDLHLECTSGEQKSGIFAQDEILNSLFGGEHKDTTLILAGDIAEGTTHEGFLAKTAKHFKHVIYVAGNHEFYFQEIDDIRLKLRQFASTIPNFHFLDPGCIILDGVRFVGATCWTDLNKNNPVARIAAGTYMNDYNLIKFDNDDGYSHLTPSDTIRFNLKQVAFIKSQLAEHFEGKTVVVTHHLPFSTSCRSEWKTKLTSFAYFNTGFDEYLDEGTRAPFDVWCHGHTHDSYDYEVNGARIICNPRGYEPLYLNKDFVLKEFEL